MRVLLLLALVGAAFAAVPRAGKRIPERIVGGTATSVEQYPYMSNMQFHLWGFFWTQFCGGALITPSSIVSAAHCYLGDRANQWRARLGTSSASSGGDVHDILKLVLHEKYDDSTIDNDIAIVKLVKPAVLNGHTISTVAVPSTTYNPVDGTSVYTIGWGDLSSGGGAPEQLQHVEISVINQEICRERYATLRGWPTITENMICAGALDVGGKDACQGDSGGPLVERNPGQDTLHGVVSWGYGCAHQFFPGVNTRVSKYSKWIVANA